MARNRIERLALAVRRALDQSPIYGPFNPLLKGRALLNNGPKKRTYQYAAGEIRRIEFGLGGEVYEARRSGELKGFCRHLFLSLQLSVLARW